GFGLSAGADVPSNPEQHVVDGIESPENYELGDSVSDVWSAASALLAAVPTARERLYLDGTSFGGGVAALAVAWDQRFARAFLEVPTFGAQELRMQLPTNGSGAAIQRWARRPGRRQQVTYTLSYFDAACAARFARVPTMVAAAESDAVVTPPGQFAIYNALRRSLAPDDARLYVLRAGHAPMTSQEAVALAAARRRWFGMD
ncbi:MAG TPA: acetylxylan esterase, partial [Myxococcota bacterium]|nr:acetylxylan esterase [Myxococcota bacterium]